MTGVCRDFGRSNVGKPQMNVANTAKTAALCLHRRTELVLVGTARRKTTNKNNQGAIIWPTHTATMRS